MKRTLPVGSYAVTPDGSVFGATADDTTHPPQSPAARLVAESTGLPVDCLDPETLARLGGPE